MNALPLLALLSTLATTVDAKAPVPPVPVQVPVVLSTTGIGGARFTSDLTIMNVSATPSTVELLFMPPGALATDFVKVTIEDELDPSVRLYIPDVIQYLRERGVPLPSGNVLGSLLVTLPAVPGDEKPPFVGSRVSSPSPGVEGTFGTYTLGVPIGQGSTFFTSIFGLRETETFRTNLAFAHAGGGSNGPIELRVQLYDGETGSISGEPILVGLQPGEWKQVSSILYQRQLREGWARITPSAGNDRYVAYAVVNDGGSAGGGTSDGSVITTGATEGTLPIVLSTGPYRTELVLANDTSNEVLVSLAYTAADALSATNVPGFATVTLPRRTQIIEPDAMAFLRRRGLFIPETGSQGGSLKVAGAAALARIYSPNPDTATGGTFGVAFQAVPAARRARSEAWIYGLRQDHLSRSNVAVTNAAAATEAAATFEVTVFDAVHGYSKVSLRRILRPGQWFQWNSILSEAPVAEGFIRVRCISSSPAACDFITYGVINDGPNPETGTSDGSYVPMVNVN